MGTLDDVSTGPERDPAAPPVDDEPVLPKVSTDERDDGWGDGGPGERGRDDQWYRDERPPHHE